MAVVSSPCLGCGLGVDGSKPAVMLDPDGNFGCGPSGLFELCGQNFLGPVASNFQNAGVSIAIPAATDTRINGLTPLASATYTNTSSCMVKIAIRKSLSVQGIGLSDNSQGAPSRIAAETSNNGAPYVEEDISPFWRILTATNGWNSTPNMAAGWNVATVTPSASYSYAIRAMVRSTTGGGTITAWAAGIQMLGWVVS